jgi:hypothetical protein
MVLGVPVFTVPKDNPLGFSAIEGVATEEPVPLTLTFSGLG